MCLSKAAGTGSDGRKASRVVTIQCCGRFCSILVFIALVEVHGGRFAWFGLGSVVGEVAGLRGKELVH